MSQAVLTKAQRRAMKKQSQQQRAESRRAARRAQDQERWREKEELAASQAAASGSGGGNGRNQPVVTSAPVKTPDQGRIIITAPRPDPRQGHWQSQVEVFGPDRIRELAVGSRVFLDPACVEKDPEQIRKNFDPAKLADLAESIKHDGQKVAGSVYLKPDDPNHVIILDSERRWRACCLKQMPFLAEVVPAPVSEIEKLGDQATLNMGREGHDHLEIILAIQRCLEAGRDDGWIGRRFVKSMTWVYSYKRAARLPRQVILMLDSSLPPDQLLRFPVALLILKFPPIRHKAIAEMVRGKTKPEASRIINRELGDTDPESGVRKRKPSENRGTFERTLDKGIAEQIQLTGMGEEEFARLFATTPPKTIEELLASMARSAELGIALQQRILSVTKATAPKPAARTASQPVTVIQRPKPEPKAADEPSIKPADGSLLAVMADFLRVCSSNDSLEPLFVGLDRQACLDALDLAEQIGLASARLRRAIKRVLPERL